MERTLPSTLTLPTTAQKHIPSGYVCPLPEKHGQAQAANKRFKNSPQRQSCDQHRRKAGGSIRSVARRTFQSHDAPKKKHIKQQWQSTSISRFAASSASTAKSNLPASQPLAAIAGKPRICRKSDGRSISCNIFPQHTRNFRLMQSSVRGCLIA